MVPVPLASRVRHKDYSSVLDATTLLPIRMPYLCPMHVDNGIIYMYETNIQDVQLDNLRYDVYYECMRVLYEYIHPITPFRFIYLSQGSGHVM